MISPLASDVLPGPTGTALHGHDAPAFRSDDRRPGAGRHQRRHAVGRRRGVAKIANDGAAPLHLFRADQPGRLDHARPCLLQGSVLSQDGARDSGADAEALRRFTDFAQALDRLDVDDQVRLDEAALHSHQEVAASGEDCSRAGRSGDQCHGIFHGQWTYVAHRLPWVFAAQLL